MTQRQPNAFRALLAKEMHPGLLASSVEGLASFPVSLPRLPDGRVDRQAMPQDTLTVRRWGALRASPKSITPLQVAALKAAVPGMVRVAYEVEDPWQAYTLESMGYMHNAGAQRLHAFMEGVWQHDERRHAAVLLAAYQGLTGETDVAPNPHRVAPVVEGPGAFQSHLAMRVLAELSATATYAALLPHTRQELHACLGNLLGDEVRHLAIFWAALKWATPHAVWRRVLSVVIHAVQVGNDHRQERNGLRLSNPQMLLLLAQVGAAMAVSLGHLVAWDATLAPGALEELFGAAPQRLVQQAA